MQKIILQFAFVIGFVGSSIAQDFTDIEKNLVYSAAYHINGAKKIQSISYFDELGKPTQSQSWDLSTNTIWATQTLYDFQGRPSLQSLGAPIGTGQTFSFKDSFILQTNNTSAYGLSNFTGGNNENPDEVGKGSSQETATLGWYYSDNNDREPYQDVTGRPYSKTIYSTLNPGQPLRVVGGNKVDTNNDGTIDGWAQSYSFSMPAAQELSQSGAFGAAGVAFENTGVDYSSMKIIKTVSRDVRGIENVVFTDTDGNTLAAARSGGSATRDMNITIEEQGFVDIHVPAGSNVGFTVSNASAVTVYNLITEDSPITPSNSLANGFYRVAVNNPDTYVAGSINVSYHENYYDYSLNEYDQANRLIASYQPLDKLKSIFKYNALGQLIYSKSPDEGEVRF